MLTLMIVLSLLAYIFIGFLSYNEYKSIYAGEPWKFGKALYVGIMSILYLLIGAFLVVLTYLIFTM